MNKSQLVDALAAASATGSTAATAVDALLQTIVDTVRSGDSVSLAGFGVFESRARGRPHGPQPAHRRDRRGARDDGARVPPGHRLPAPSPATRAAAAARPATGAPAAAAPRPPTAPAANGAATPRQAPNGASADGSRPAPARRGSPSRPRRSRPSAPSAAQRPRPPAAPRRRKNGRQGRTKAAPRRARRARRGSSAAISSGPGASSSRPSTSAAVAQPEHPGAALPRRHVVDVDRHR